jgi:AcrR family transcriptional regulator
MHHPLDKVFTPLDNISKHVYFYCKTMETRVNTEGADAKRGRGRPAGRSQKGASTERHLYETALTMFAAQGYEETTLRQIAKQAGVSPGLLYRYFPSKRAVVLALYQNLSAHYADQVESMAEGSWRDRFFYALETSIATLSPHRNVLSGLIPVLLGRSDEGLFAAPTSFARLRVENAFVTAVTNAKDAPKDADSLGWTLYLLHLAVLLWWLLDRTVDQQGTKKLLVLIRKSRMLMGLAVTAPFAPKLLSSFANISRASLLGRNDLLEV